MVAPAGEFCPFALRIAGVSASTVRPGTTSDNLIVTGAVTATVTNLETDESRRYNISGPTFIDAETGRLVLTGTALVGQPANQNVGSTVLIVTRGRVTFTAANTIESNHGTIARNVCVRRRQRRLRRGGDAHLQRHGVKVGQDIAVTGFNDFPFASMLDTPLTTARIPLRDIAVCLFDRALREISGDPDQPSRLVTAPLVVRASA
ncbi:substrate-binding domain-containing protein [Kribbella sp. VKM Ac-2568]|uniref:substrate-binding domain-containing protein n=1 Tax=Kribbella sp. VKM Ac-2568 TaxID=2512219 RepID=UPI00104C9BA1|nr:substrate-binding domain-containing protein [Kribbella sp. VKM Ac-2568]TCM44322.1 substrate-binding family protein [Kribbella sp. VKM Ac-2568]